MIVNSTPLPGEDFLTLEEARRFSRRAGNFPDFSPLFYDIETTGLSPKSSQVYLIGAISWEDSAWNLTQWFASGSDEEGEILSAFGKFLRRKNLTVQYNGDRFDQPFLTARCEHWNLHEPFKWRPSLDLYRKLSCCRELFALPSMKQTDLESLVELPPRTYPGGKEGIQLYREFARTRDPRILEKLLGHNREDLMGLLQIYPLLSCLALFLGDYVPFTLSFQQDELFAVLKLPEELLVELSLNRPGFHMRVEGDEIRLLVSGKEGRLKRYYENFKDYVYLPGEDMAIPRDLSSYMDRTLYVPAKRETCYTWFAPGKAFLNDPKQQKEYFQSLLAYYLNN